MNPIRLGIRLDRVRRALDLAVGLVLAGVMADAQVVPQPAPSQVIVPLALPAELTSLGQSVVVDWSKGVLIASGRSKVAANLSDAQAETRGPQAARVDAMRLLLVAVDGMPVTSGATIAQCKVNSRGLTLRIEAILKSAAFVAGSEKLERQADGSRLASIALSLPLSGKTGLWSAVMSEWTACATPSVSTGLIVDARGLDFVPCLGVRFLTQDGTVFWDGANVLAVKPNLLTAAGLARSLEAAGKQRDRVGSNPLSVKATEARGITRCDLVFEVGALQAIQQSKLERSLSEGRVVIAFE